MLKGKNGSRSSQSASGRGTSKAQDGRSDKDGQDRLEYVAQMLKELRLIAEQAGEGTLVYMIEMAALEADEAVRLKKLASRLTG